MEEPAEETAEKKQGRGFWGYVYWAGVILLLYVLSAGPFMMMWEKGVWRSRPGLLETLYSPLSWAYGATPLRKPLGMYIHMWCPETFDNNGDLRMPE